MSNTTTLYKIHGQNGIAYTLSPRGRSSLCDDGNIYELPPGFTEGKSAEGAGAIFDDKGRPCTLIAHGPYPALIVLGNKHPVALPRVIPKTEGSRMRQRRLALGYTQTDLAKTAGIDVAQIKRMESGDSGMQNIRLGSAIRIARTLGLELEELL